MSEVRVRFAPSPTGYLHIGGVRTALYSWLWARQTGGTFILRIEDTDQDRSTAESIHIVLESMRWLGLDWDEGPEIGGGRGPYFQSERLDLYADYADRLLASGHAYRCYATKQEIADARDAFHKTSAKGGFRFQSPWRDRTDRPKDRDAHVIRFRAPHEGTTGWDDEVKGLIEVPNDTQQDFILLRPNGMPLYNFGCVIDDLTMEVTLAARGDDHIINTAPQILLYQALGAEPPKFAHMPMVLAPNGEKLSKRHAAVGVLEYRNMGYLPDAVLNYLARLGWSHGDQEIFTRQELIEKFSWDHVGSTAGRYDSKKFVYVQEEHLRMLPDAEIARLTVPFLAEIGVVVGADDPVLLAAVPYVKPRSATLADVADGVRYFFGEVEFEQKGKRKFLVPENAPHLVQLAELIEGIEPFEKEKLDEVVKGWLEANELPMKKVAQPARVAMTGRTRSPGLFEVMEVLGKDRTIARLRAAAELAAAATTH
ncbi:MAG: glutamate--tRNA ligase [Myxococcales bacterium]|nr:glutamate--tRNA ligase [Myxococcales bacterium]MDH3485498.1 glutamate--tRNA ligase [Myxococcales bacterium]